MTRAEFISCNSLLALLEGRGLKVIGVGNSRMVRCPFHEDKDASMSVKVSDGTWYCHSCKIGGGVIDFMAKLEGITPIEFIKRNNITSDSGNEHLVAAPKSNVEKLYSYRDEIGREVYQVMRFVPKSFRQRRPDGKGGWIYSMEGVERVLYRLPEVAKAETVWIVEGEKDADNLVALGFCATCNAGGAGKWLDGYTQSLNGKDVVLCGDNDEPGRKHIEQVFEAIAGKVKCAKLVSIPQPFKDISEFIVDRGEKAKEEISKLCADAVPFYKGIKLPLFSMAEIEPRYQKQASSLDICTLDLGVWLPSIRGAVRRLIPGEMVLLIGDTGTGKTCILQSIAKHSRPLPTLFFEMELPEELLYERAVAMQMDTPCRDIEEAYRKGTEFAGAKVLDTMFTNLLICTETGLSLETLERYIVRSELKMGEKPVLVLIDYVQLMSGTGKRYERISDAAEGLKGIAKRTRTIIIIASQVHRSEDEEISLHSAKDSGALENSAGLVIGITRTPNSGLLLKILKNTKGKAGKEIPCLFNGETMVVRECATNFPDYTD